MLIVLMFTIFGRVPTTERENEKCVCLNTFVNRPYIYHSNFSFIDVVILEH